jgi:hypothetical protein
MHRQPGSRKTYQIDESSYFDNSDESRQALANVSDVIRQHHGRIASSPHGVHEFANYFTISNPNYRRDIGRDYVTLRLPRSLLRNHGVAVQGVKTTRTPTNTSDSLQCYSKERLDAANARRKDKSEKKLQDRPKQVHYEENVFEACDGNDCKFSLYTIDLTQTNPEMVYTTAVKIVEALCEVDALPKCIKHWRCDAGADGLHAMGYFLFQSADGIVKDVIDNSELISQFSSEQTLRKAVNNLFDRIVRAGVTLGNVITGFEKISYKKDGNNGFKLFIEDISKATIFEDTGEKFTLASSSTPNDSLTATVAAELAAFNDPNTGGIYTPGP